MQGDGGRQVREGREEPRHTEDVCVCVCVCMCIDMYLYECMFAMYARTHVCMHACTYAFMHARMHLCI